jgi:hypothetical protein
VQGASQHSHGFVAAKVLKNGADPNEIVILETWEVDRPGAELGTVAGDQGGDEAGRRASDADRAVPGRRVSDG